MTIDHILTLLLAVPAVGLLPLYVGRSQAAQEQALATIGATTPGGAI